MIYTLSYDINGESAVIGTYTSREKAVAMAERWSLNTSEEGDWTSVVRMDLEDGRWFYAHATWEAGFEEFYVITMTELE